MKLAKRLMVVLFTVVALVGTLAVLTPVEATNVKPCKACQAQPWCACKYNGYPRISCDPCCYSTGYGQICTS